MSYVLAAVGMLVTAHAVSAQVEYRNLDGGRPVRIEDATPTEKNGLDLDLTTLRLDRLGPGRERLQVEPRMAYGIRPNTEVSLRIPVFFRERTQSPRAGIAGLGLGAMRQLRIESLRVPSIAFATEAFVPTGANAAATAFSGKALLTKSFTAARIHLNASYGSYSLRLPPPPVAGPTCGQAGQPPCVEVPLLPPLDGPCDLAPSGAPMPVSFSCSASSRIEMGAPGGQVITHGHWLVGVAADKAFALKSLLVVADLFAERFDGIGRVADWTAELGLRHQVTPWLVVDGAVGRHFYGTTLSSFVTFGTSYTRALLFPSPH